MEISKIGNKRSRTIFGASHRQMMRGSKWRKTTRTNIITTTVPITGTAVRMVLTLRKTLNTKTEPSNEEQLNDEVKRCHHLGPVFQHRSEKRRRFGPWVIEQAGGSRLYLPW